MNNIDHPFTRELISWFSKTKRTLPWRETKDPYRIWLSEIILQQTRVDQGLPYFNRFIECFPTLESLARTDQVQILKLWEGLGYYSRARNMHETARLVMEKHGGNFPHCYSDLLKLKGIGPYTAAAIASIAYDEPVPVVDGNVFRFISRYFGIYEDTARAKTRSVFSKVLSELISHKSPGVFNQACMEYGAVVCKPALPDCASCIFRTACYAQQHKVQKELPVKSKTITIKERFLHYFIISHNDHYLLRERTENIWKGLFEFHLVENTSRDIPELDVLFSEMTLSVDFDYSPVRHLLSHRILWVSFHRVEVKKEGDFIKIKNHLNMRPYSREEVLTLPRPKVIVNFLQHGGF